LNSEALKPVPPEYAAYSSTYHIFKRGDGKMQQLFDFFLVSDSIELVDVVINIACTAIMSQLVYLAFIRFGNTFSNRKHFGKIFLIIAVCTTLVITLIKASLALSLGLVGALSIVRFRAAVKEPEELAYTFLCIAIGLGFGTGERGLTFVVGFIILIILAIRGLFNIKKTQTDTYNFSVITSKMDIDVVVDVLGEYTSKIHLRRSDNDGKTLNVHFNIEFSNVTQLKKAVDKLRSIDNDVITSFVSNSTLI